MEIKSSFAELAKIRQSDRKYKEQPVEREKILQDIDNKLLEFINSDKYKDELLMMGNLGNYSLTNQIYILLQNEKKEQIAECSIGLGMNKFTHQCPVMIAVVLEKQNFMSSIGSIIKNKDYCLFDLGIAVNQFCLQAADLGLGTCIIGWFDEKKIKKILGVRNRRIPLLISLGYPDAPTREKVRKPLEVMSSWNQY